MGTKRTEDSGREDALGRKIKTAGQRPPARPATGAGPLTPPMDDFTATPATEESPIPADATPREALHAAQASGGDPATTDQAYDVITSGDDHNAAWLFAQNFSDQGYDVAPLQQVVERSGSPSDCYVFAQSIPGADIPPLQEKAVTDTGDPISAYMFGKEVPGADLRGCEKVIAEAGDQTRAYLFAKEVSGADVKAMEDVVLDSGDAAVSLHFARDIPGADVSRHQQAVVDAAEPHKAYEFSRDVPGADVAALGEVVKASGNKSVQYQFDQLDRG